MAVRLSALRTGRTLLPRNIIIFTFLVLISVRRRRQTNVIRNLPADETCLPKRLLQPCSTRISGLERNVRSETPTSDTHTERNDSLLIRSALYRTATELQTWLKKLYRHFHYRAPYGSDPAEPVTLISRLLMPYSMRFRTLNGRMTVLKGSGRKRRNHSMYSVFAKADWWKLPEISVKIAAVRAGIQIETLPNASPDQAVRSALPAQHFATAKSSITTEERPPTLVLTCGNTVSSATIEVMNVFVLIGCVLVGGSVPQPHRQLPGSFCIIQSSQFPVGYRRRSDSLRPDDQSAQPVQATVNPNNIHVPMLPHLLSKPRQCTTFGDSEQTNASETSTTMAYHENGEYYYE
jgi:hypothetical protein